MQRTTRTRMRVLDLCFNLRKLQAADSSSPPTGETFSTKIAMLKRALDCMIINGLHLGATTTLACGFFDWLIDAFIYKFFSRPEMISDCIRVALFLWVNGTNFQVSFNFVSFRWKRRERGKERNYSKQTSRRQKSLVGEWNFQLGCRSANRSLTCAGNNWFLMFSS